MVRGGLRMQHMFQVEGGFHWRFGYGGLRGLSRLSKGRVRLGGL